MNQDLKYKIEQGQLMTLPKDCKCACHAVPHATVLVHIRPCCGPGSEGWPTQVSERDPYETLTLFGDVKGTQSREKTSLDESADGKP